MTPLALGIDLGTSGVRIALLDQDDTLLFTQAVSYRSGLGQPLDWSDACTELIRSIPNALRDRVRAIGNPVGLQRDGHPPGAGVGLLRRLPGASSDA